MITHVDYEYKKFSRQHGSMQYNEKPYQILHHNEKYGIHIEHYGL